MLWFNVLINFIIFHDLYADTSHTFCMQANKHSWIISHKDVFCNMYMFPYKDTISYHLLANTSKGLFKIFDGEIIQLSMKEPHKKKSSISSCSSHDETVNDTEQSASNS